MVKEFWKNLWHFTKRNGILFRDAIRESFWIKGRFWIKNLTIKSTYKMYNHGNKRPDFPKAFQLLSFAQEVLNFTFIKGFIF